MMKVNKELKLNQKMCVLKIPEAYTVNMKFFFSKKSPGIHHIGKEEGVS